MIYVGLDVSLNSVAVCAVDETGKLVREGTTLADAPSIVQYLEPWAGQVQRVGLEGGPTSEWLTANLIELGLPAVSLEARQVKAALSAMPVKTDRNDARGIAQVVRTGWFKPVHVKSIGSQRARSWPRLASISSVPSLPQSKSSADFCVRSAHFAKTGQQFR
ncbi:IS110 family transposase [Bradyrhizobium nanningense]|uniref:IS110 family transposase n=1 Tax=Bradyrhizobium nanningense TaxID=1325118 RepID=UPI001FE0CE3B|nr:transposase [Bradyrhizobium nanningense]